jgi:hypothetical protein
MKIAHSGLRGATVPNLLQVLNGPQQKLSERTLIGTVAVSTFGDYRRTQTASSEYKAFRSQMATATVQIQ